MGIMPSMLQLQPTIPVLQAQVNVPRHHQKTIKKHCVWAGFSVFRGVLVDNSY
jgi:hypothetical protein